MTPPRVRLRAAVTLVAFALGPLLLGVAGVSACSQSPSPVRSIEPIFPTDGAATSDAGVTPEASATSDGGPADGGTTQVMMSFDRAGGFYTAPFPSDDLVIDGGTADLSKFPNPNDCSYMTQTLALASTNVGFGCSSGVFFETTGPLDPTTLPDLAGSEKGDASAFVMSVEPSSADYLKRYPVHVAFVGDALLNGPFGDQNLLSLVPLQGYPFRPSTAYAAVITNAVKDASGNALAQNPAVALLASGQAPAGMNANALPTYAKAFAALAKAGISTASIAGLAAFTTGDPTAQTNLFRTSILSLPQPAPDTPFTQYEAFDEYCVYESTIAMPDYQAGTPPFSTDGGGWATDPSGNPVVQRNEEARIFVTIPRKTIPAGGFPIELFIRTGAGGDLPIVDRGPQGSADGPALVPGTGPALYFARAGFAGASIDGPLGGLRNTTNANEDFTVFNINNLLALRDNIRQSALELMLQAHILGTISFDVSDCAGAAGASGGTTATFDVTHLGIMGHSMGATILPLAAALEPGFKTVILSGAGSSWIENLLYKEMPINMKPAVEFLLQYDVSDGQVLTEQDPAMSIFQWALESADPQVYDYRVIDEPGSSARPRSVLMFQGIVDHYILPDIANATTLTLGIDLAGTEIDNSSQEPAGQTLISSVLPFVDRSVIGYPVSGNIATDGGAVITGALVQAPGDAILDGHEVVFQTDPPKHQYECFLESVLTGAPSVLAPAPSDAGCAGP